MDRNLLLHFSGQPTLGTLPSSRSRPTAPPRLRHRVCATAHPPHACAQVPAPPHAPSLLDVRCDRAFTTPVTPYNQAKQEWVDND